MGVIDYKSAGVNIDAGNEAVNRIKDGVKSTFTSNVLTGIGSFGSLYDLKPILDNLLKRLPGGLDGNLGEEGINLSGGEIQRIGLCRALIYDPQILCLDEATSSLDVRTETQILEELKVFEEKTIISIAHRINTLKNCDKIYCFSNGKIVDEGNFNKFRMQN